MQSAFSLLLIIGVCIPLDAQRIWHVPDPEGNAILIDPDSAFVFRHKSIDLMALYAIDGDGNLNILITDCVNSRWLFTEGWPRGVTYSPIHRVTFNRIAFAIDSVWYTTNQTFTQVLVWHDNRDTSKQYILSMDEVVLETFEKWLVAFERTTGERVLLHYNAGNNTFSRRLDMHGNDIRVFYWLEKIELENQHYYFVGSTYDPEIETWRVPGLYGKYVGIKPYRLLDLYNHHPSDIKSIRWGSGYIIDIHENPSKIYRYNNSEQELVDVTNTILEGYEVINVEHMYHPFYENDILPYDIFQALWKVRNENGSIQYVLSDFFSSVKPGWFIHDIQDVDHVNTMNTSAVHDDTIYYYNYDDSQHALVRLHFRNGGVVKEPTSIPVGPEYRLFGWEGKMYHVRYDAADDALYACSADYDEYMRSRYLESYDGIRIPNPIRYHAFRHYMVVESRTDSGHLLFVYDSTTVTQVDDIHMPVDASIGIFPNPAHDTFQVIISEDTRYTGELLYGIYDRTGVILRSGRLAPGANTMDAEDMPAGVYLLQVTQGSEILGTKRLVLLN